MARGDLAEPQLGVAASAASGLTHSAAARGAGSDIRGRSIGLFPVPPPRAPHLLRTSACTRPVCKPVIGKTVAAVIITSLLGPASALEVHPSTRNPLAVNHQPMFITAPGETDVLLVIIALVVVAVVLGFGVFFFWLHNLPERLVHNSTKAQFDIVAALALLSLLTHIHLFWVLALLIALVKIPMPDFTGLLGRIAGSLEQIAGATPGTSTNPGPPKSSDPPPQGT